MTIKTQDVNLEHDFGICPNCEMAYDLVLKRCLYCSLGDPKT